MKRTGIIRKPWGMRRRVDPDALNPDSFLLETQGRVWRWPQAWMSEADWQGTVEDWAIKIGDRRTKMFHDNSPQRNMAGWVDLVCFQPTRGMGFLFEFKVRDRAGDANTISAAQGEFIYAGIACGYDVRVLTFPDDAFATWEAVTGRPREECPYWEETKEAR